MSTAAETGSAARFASRAQSVAFRTFAIVMAITGPIIYVVCEMQNWPLFTYHPGTDRFDWFYAAARRNEGPAMHWYGWTANTLIGSALLGYLATFLPERLAARIPIFLVWAVPLLTVPILIYALRFFWRW